MRRHEGFRTLLYVRNLLRSPSRQSRIHRPFFFLCKCDETRSKPRRREPRLETAPHENRLDYSDSRLPALLLHLQHRCGCLHSISIVPALIRTRCERSLLWKTPWLNSILEPPRPRSPIAVTFSTIENVWDRKYSWARWKRRDRVNIALLYVPRLSFSRTIQLPLTNCANRRRRRAFSLPFVPPKTTRLRAIHCRASQCLPPGFSVFHPFTSRGFIVNYSHAFIVSSIFDFSPGKLSVFPRRRSREN